MSIDEEIDLNNKSNDDDVIIDKNDFPIVGIGASAGGLEALKTFFTNMPSDSGFAFVVIQHLSPDYKSLMKELLSKDTSMPVYEVSDKQQVQQNCIYLIPRNKHMTIYKGHLYLTNRLETSEKPLNLPIDIFFNSLAIEKQEKAIAIILSGTGSDGTRGIRTIKEEGGMVMVQNETSAKFDGMPRSAIATQLVDYILPAEQMPVELINYIKHPTLTNGVLTTSTLTKEEETFNRIFTLLRRHHKIDFTFYKPKTMVRRIERRMNINQITTLANYLAYLEQSQMELSILHKELLIGVTQFFRNQEEWAYLQTEVLPQLFANKKPHEQVRVWVTACSSGEEAYTVAILLKEYMEEHNYNNPIKIFATDIHREAMEIAGRGIYPESIVADISKKRLHRHFFKKGESYQISQSIREMVIFARQNLISDPPFSKIDLITCRNVLIYFQSVLQKKVFSLFAFSLNQNGFLFLGSSETIGDFLPSFQQQHKKWKIYQYKSNGPRPSLQAAMQVPSRERGLVSSPVPPSYLSPQLENRRANQTLYHALIENSLPPSVVVDDQFNLLHAFGNLHAYLRVPTGGSLSWNILKMVPPELSIALSTALHKVIKEEKPTIYKNVVLKNGLETTSIDLIASPLVDPNTSQTLILIQFKKLQLAIEPNQESQNEESFRLDSSVMQRIADLEHDLQYTRENLQATIEEMETSNEELQATNEELLAANEELQSTNEELQSVNEELITVNAEYQAKIRELTKLNNDISNLFSSTDTGTIFLDERLQIRKFTPVVQRLINLIETDIGRPINHISHTLIDFDLAQEAEIVLKTMKKREHKVGSIHGKWYLIKTMLYRTLENEIEGIVITFVDITELEIVNKELLQMSTVVQQSPNLITLIDKEGTITYVNKAVTESTNYLITELEGMPFNKLIVSQVNLDQMWAQAMESGEWRGELTYKTTDNNLSIRATASIVPLSQTGTDQELCLCVAENIERRYLAEASLMSYIHRWYEFAWQSRSEAVSILLVGQNILTLDQLSNSLTAVRVNHHLQLLENQSEAIELLKQKETETDTQLPQLIFVHVNSATQDGLALIEALYRRPHWRSIPFVALVDTHVEIKTLQKYASASNIHILHPIKQDKLIQAIGIALDPDSLVLLKSEGGNTHDTQI